MKIAVTGPRLTADDVARWRLIARTASDRALCEVVADNIAEVVGASEWPDRINVQFRSGERLLITVDREIAVLAVGPELPPERPPSEN